nr:MAG TPA: hypothetical protein [Caudoviricetes sp.]
MTTSSFIGSRSPKRISPPIFSPPGIGGLYYL